MKDREQLARTNVEEAIKAVSAEWTITQLQRLGDGYTLKLQNGSRTFRRTGLDEAVLEDDDSRQRERLIEDARRELEVP